MFKVILYYKYVPVDNPKALLNEHNYICKKLGLTGRIIISKEGINGTLGGEIEYIEEYKKYLTDKSIFSDIEFKESIEDKNAFKKLKVKVRKEIVTLNLEYDISLDKKAKYISPKEFKEIISTKEEYYLVDARNNYETQIGKFKNAVTLDINNFRDLPQAVKKIENLKDKKVIMYCTGGVRCEKASAFLIDNGFKNVSQLHGGIIKYGQTFPDGNFKGKCYVFDERISVDVNNLETTSIISNCLHCNTSSDRYINCCNVKCNLQFICCEKCDKKMGSGCSKDCKSKSRFLKNKI